jgi:excisionase family DNA binding protein
MRLETRVFDLYTRKYASLFELAEAMGMTTYQVYRVRWGKGGISEKFIIGALQALPEYTLNDLFYVVPNGSKSEGAANEAGREASSRRNEVVKLRNAGLSYAEIGRRLGISHERSRQIFKGRNPAKPRKPSLDSRVMLTTGDVAQLLGVHVNTVRRLRNEGILKSYRINLRGDLRFRRKDVDVLLK